MSIAFRFAEPHDHLFVIDGWLTSYRDSHSSGFFQVDDWRSFQWGQIEQVIKRPDILTVVAYETDDDTRIADLYGFITVDTQTDSTPYVLYVYVPTRYRKFGIARKLFASVRIDPDKPFRYACKTGIVSKLAMKIPMSKHDPLPARFLCRRDHERATAAAER